ncbi:MBL fold metallo-hydrolase [soil metagenome]
MRLVICGARGSTPSPGPDFVRYGGNTSCVALTHGDEAPRLVLDAGTGLPNATALLKGEPFRGTILLGHLHWDHTHGLPFFAAGDLPGGRAELVVPSQGNPEDLMERILSPPHFPVTIHQLRGDWSVRNIEAGEHELEGFSILALDIPHKGGRMLGYRITDGSTTIAYVSDHSPVAFGPGPDGLGDYHDAICTLSDGVDLLIHDAQHTAEEFEQRASFGHAAIEYAVGLASASKARRLLLFHHDPARSYDELDAIAVEAGRSNSKVEGAIEGSTISLGD